jgi:Protein of unknown function (DUF4199)
MRKTVLTFGLIAGGVLAGMMVLTTVLLKDKIGFDKGAIIGYTTMVAAFLMIYVGIRSYRDTVAGGMISFGRAVTVGLLITAVATACYVATWQVIFFKFTPDFVDKYAAYEMQKVAKAGGTQAQRDAKAKEMADFTKMYQNPLINAAFTFLEPLPVGVLLTLVSAGLLRRKTPLTPEAQ